MTALVWNLEGERTYETGVDRGVLFPRLTPGVAWNGLVSVDEAVDGGESEALYFDGFKYCDFVAAESFQAVIEVYSVPPEFAECDGIKQLSPGLFVGQQPRVTFGFCYRSRIGNDLLGTNYGYKLHLVYGATALPTTKQMQTVTDRVNLGTRQWTVKTVPPEATQFKPTAHFVIDSTKASEFGLSFLEHILYGEDGGDDPRLPTQAEVIAALS